MFRFLGPLMIVAVMAATHPVPSSALGVLGGQISVAWVQLAGAGDCVTPGGGSCIRPFALQPNARPASDRQISF
jgi:hypothetical protein